MPGREVCPVLGPGDDACPGGGPGDLVFFSYLHFFLCPVAGPGLCPVVVRGPGVGPARTLWNFLSFSLFPFSFPLFCAAQPRAALRAEIFFRAQCCRAGGLPRRWPRSAARRGPVDGPVGEAGKIQRPRQKGQPRSGPGGEVRCAQEAAQWWAAEAYGGKGKKVCPGDGPVGGKGVPRSAQEVVVSGPGPL